MEIRSVSGEPTGIDGWTGTKATPVQRQTRMKVSTNDSLSLAENFTRNKLQSKRKGDKKTPKLR